MMRAKLQVRSIRSIQGNTTAETLRFGPVCPKEGYPADGTDENNSFARWTPHADLAMTIQNPDLIGKFKVGDVFYLDFTPAE